MPSPKNKNEELQQQDHEILEAIFDRKQTLSEYAIARCLTYEEAEKWLSDALRRKKTALTFLPEGYAPANDCAHHVRQGFRTVFRSGTSTIKLLAAEMFLDFDDLDAWMEVD